MDELKNQIYDSMMRDYILVYVIDLENDTIDLIKREEGFTTSDMEDHDTYSVFHSKHCENVTDTFREERYERGTIAYLKDYLSKNDSFEYSYPTIFGTYRKVVYRALERRNGVAVKVLFSLLRVDDSSDMDFLRVKGDELALVPPDGDDSVFGRRVRDLLLCGFGCGGLRYSSNERLYVRAFP